MTRHIVTDDETVIKRPSQRILYALWSSDQPLSSSELATQLDVDDNGFVHYRIQNKLGRDAEGFIAQAGQETSRGPVAMKTWRLTPAGEEWVEEHMGAIEPPQTLDEFIERQDGLENTVENNRDAVLSIRGSWKWTESRVEGVEKRTGELERKVEAIWEYLKTYTGDPTAHPTKQSIDLMSEDEVEFILNELKEEADDSDAESDDGKDES